MSKKVIVVSSSPRTGGNSDFLCNSFIEGAISSGNTVEKIMINTKEISYCVGCGYCFNNVGKCSRNDDMSDIGNELIDADVIVFATPIYFYTMCGQMKTFIDRLCSIHTKLKDKEFYYIMTAAEGNISAMDRTVEEFGGLTTCLENPKVKGIIKATGVWNIGEVNNTKFVEEAFEMGVNI